MMFFFSIFFFLPTRNSSKEYVLFDENTGKVYVLDKESYDQMRSRKENSYEASKQNQSTPLVYIFIN